MVNPTTFLGYNPKVTVDQQGCIVLQHRTCHGEWEGPDLTAKIGWTLTLSRML